MRWSIIRSEPDFLPVSLAEAQQHVRLFVVDGESPDDELLTAYIQAAADTAENFTERVFAQRAVTLMTDRFSPVFELPVFPVLSITSIKYLDTDGIEQTLDPSEYLFDPHVIPAILEISNPPATKDQRNAVTIEVIAGYESEMTPPGPDRIPRAVKQAILMAAGHFFANREDVAIGTIATQVPMAFERLLWPYRVLGI